MDQIKIGKFIAAMRKKQGLSQKQLAEQIGVTDKTISKWETGHRMPDASILLELSLALQVDVNELLAGEEFSSEEYVEKSESNLINLVGELDEIHQKRKSGGIGTAIGIFLITLAFLALLCTSLRKGNFSDIFDWPTLLYLLGLKIFILSISGWFHEYMNAWKVCVLKRKFSEKEMQLSIQAVKYAEKLSLALGCLIFSIGIFSLLNYDGNPNSTEPALAQAVLAFFYTAAIETAYVIVEFKIKRMLHIGA